MLLKCDVYGRTSVECRDQKQIAAAYAEKQTLTCNMWLYILMPALRLPGMVCGPRSRTGSTGNGQLPV